MTRKQLPRAAKKRKMFLLWRILFICLSPWSSPKSGLNKAGGLRFHICDACCYFTEAVGGIDFMSANRTRLPTTATRRDNYHTLKLTKDCVIWWGHYERQKAFYCSAKSNGGRERERDRGVQSYIKRKGGRNWGAITAQQWSCLIGLITKHYHHHRHYVYCCLSHLHSNIIFDFWCEQKQRNWLCHSNSARGHIYMIIYLLLCVLDNIFDIDIPWKGYRHFFSGISFSPSKHTHIQKCSSHYNMLTLLVFFTYLLNKTFGSIPRKDCFCFVFNKQSFSAI